MKSIITFIVASTLFFTFGCNYDYGNYGKDKKDTNTEQKSEEVSPAEQKSEEGTPSDWQVKLEGGRIEII